MRVGASIIGRRTTGAPGTSFRPGARGARAPGTSNDHGKTRRTPGPALSRFPGVHRRSGTHAPGAPQRRTHGKRDH
eukprot:15450019-Alexandrium_andersonii.AAC.1